ncbi:MAG: YiiX/YebB-like N1pC/P60 family cysteine hydrolase [Bacteroidales bacterium]|nr:YiiX/YebB-like N1pC/P60 family cysteine hydrolase [Bacteroidales bacterium]
MKRLFFFALYACWILTAAAFGSVKVDDLRDADLLFVVNTKGNAITAVTEGTDSLPIDHVAVLYRDAVMQVPCVLQADYEGVRCSTLAQFCTETVPDSSFMLLVGRVNCPIDAPASLNRAFSHLGKPYDFYYLADDSEIYCSELVQISYVDTQGRLIFSTIPMTFRNASGEIPEFWQSLYRKRGIPVPEGAPGTNPGELSRRKEVTILGVL